ncbi:carbohydrate kinase family protein [Aureibacillus halotolerans]|uniref:Fructokinase n=1 Tax=Aureibacillus halotolerans TaxID=1508390 RepID=A0A4R6TY16_9BACI|nr:carbohydrate kinase [Aureibacillus halotolerans]TDQ37702.1 fructokinase [Aureibacillus halotolerans]
MINVTALGELLIDFTTEGTNDAGLPIFTANPGGAPGNVLVALSSLGEETAFIGCVGKDKFGSLLESTLQAKGVNTSGLIHSNIHTTLAFVKLDGSGDRSFSFCRNPGADIMLAEKELALDLISQSRIFHVGSLSMTDEPVRGATRAALKHAKQHKKLISFDPNLRPLLWRSLDEAKECMLEVMAYADIVKVSEEELEFLTGTKDIDLGAQALSQQFNFSLLFVTQGQHGSSCYCQGTSVFSPGIAVQAIDTTGCGDAFVAGVLHQLLEKTPIDLNLNETEMRSILDFGNSMGAFVATRKGGIPAMPTLEQIAEFRSR